jgi:dihydroxy-acid dehydratase
MTQRSRQSAASPELMKHRGRALVFDSPEAYYAVCDDDDFDVDADDVLVVRYAGPKGYPGMPEVSNVTLPAKLLKKGVTDMVRVCDGRMSGTGFGTVVLHVAPEAALGGPLALVETGDMIELDVAARSLHLDVADEELARRRSAWSPPAPRRGPVTPGCTSNMCCRPTGERTSTSCSAAAGTPFPETRTNVPRLALTP